MRKWALLGAVNGNPSKGLGRSQILLRTENGHEQATFSTFDVKCSDNINCDTSKVQLFLSSNGICMLHKCIEI